MYTHIILLLPVISPPDPMVRFVDYGLSMAFRGADQRFFAFSS